jgi:hypothetical protein
VSDLALWVGLAAASVTSISAVLVAVLRMKTVLRDDHDNLAGTLGRVEGTLDRIERRLDAHLEWHSEGNGPHS